MKKSFFKTLVIMIAAVTVVSGCTQGTTTSTIAPNTTTPTTTITPTTTAPTTYLTNDDFERAKTSYIDARGVEHSLTMQTLYTNAGAPHLDPLQEQHVLVVPFGFEDSSTLPEQTQDNLDRIQKTFFGSQAEIDDVNGWTSVSTYYNTASYGKSKFDGAVIPTWLVYPGTVRDFEKYSNSGAYGFDAALYARDWYVKEYAKDGHGLLGENAKPLSYFDANGDGFIDLIWIVYSRKTGQPGDWWAYVTYNQSAQGNKTNPVVKTLGFAGVDWMKKAYGGYDPHTFIHETGHTYGLDDYYDYNNTRSLMGKVDMMDNNIGDHNAFSKFSLGWLNPLVVDIEANETAKITLYPTTLDENSAVVLPSPGYNNTAFDEYLMLDFVAPVGLNEKDYKNGYESVTGYTAPGIRLMHVDARVYQGSRDAYLTTNPQDGVGFRVDNSYGGRMGLKVDGDYIERDDGSYGYYSLISLIESTVDKELNVNTSKAYNASSAKSLFKENERFTMSGRTGKAFAETYLPAGKNLWNKAKTIKGWKTVDGKDAQIQEIDENCTIDYSFKVVEIVKDDTYGYKATIEITKNA